MEWDNPNAEGTFGFMSPNLKYSSATGFNYTPESQGTNWFGNGGIVGGISGGLQALSGLANAYMGYKNYGLAKKQFGFQKALANRNLANQAKMINTQYNSAALVGAGLSGATIDPQGNLVQAGQAAKDRALEYAKERYVDGSKI